MKQASAPHLIPVTFFKTLIAFTLLQLAVYAAHAAPTATVSQYGITFTFDRSYEVGQFANGDYWVTLGAWAQPGPMRTCRRRMC